MSLNKQKSVPASASSSTKLAPKPTKINKLKDLKCRNHNTAYCDLIKKQLAQCSRILDVGCGEGALVRYLNDGSKILVGIDPDAYSDRGCITDILSNGKIQPGEIDFDEETGLLIPRKLRNDTW